MYIYYYLNLLYQIFKKYHIYTENIKNINLAFKYLKKSNNVRMEEVSKDSGDSRFSERSI